MSKIRWFTNPLLVEPQAAEQIERTASMPFVTGLAVMPDVHLGKGSTVGTVVATEGAIMPACVGVDIGCGMIAVRTSLTPDAIRPHLRAIREGIERRIPVGIGPYGMNSKILPTVEARIEILHAFEESAFGMRGHMDQRTKDWQRQLGSLGGGNHFIEVCVGFPFVSADAVAHTTDSEEVWIILHSGSRAIGHKVASYWTKKAQTTAKLYQYDSFLPDPDLAFLTSNSADYHHYLGEAVWCQKFAQMNRDEMMDRVLTELAYAVAAGAGVGNIPEIELERINCHHNYINTEVHDGKTLTITRKGAILAADGTRGLIPGSMGARSYVVTGLGHPGSFRSAPHGAGRRMSRGAARKAFTLDQVTAEMAALGIEARIREAIVDEAPGSYKDIDKVMEEASELVRPTHVLKQLISVKGD